MEHGDGAAAMHSEMAAGRTSPDDPASCSCDRTMSTTNATGHTSTGTTDVQRDEISTFGVDRQGRRHGFADGRSKIVVMDGDAIVHVEAIDDDATVERWVEFIADETDGWIDQWLDADSFGEALDRKHAALAEADR